MGNRSTVRQQASTLYRGYIEPNVTLAIRGRPRLDVSLLRSLGDYRDCIEAVTEKHAQWLRSEWLRETTDHHRLQGYCAACRAWRRFAIDHHVSSEFEGRPIPWWRETVTCPNCRLNTRMRLSVHLLEDHLNPSRDARIYLTEATTSFFARVARRFRHVVGSECLTDTTPRGEINAAGIRSEDLTALTLADASIDFLLCLEVLEHIPDYRAALRQCARVLRPGGTLLLTAPFHANDRNLVKARIGRDGQVEHLEAPEYHGDPLSPEGCLCFYHFGWELLDDLRSAGFSDVAGVMCWSRDLAYLGANLVQFVARR